jgi:glucose/arabinose dehydrogenase
MITIIRALAVSGLLLAVASPVPIAGRQNAAFELRPGDHIAIIGNTLAERLQHDGWLETMIHTRFPTADLTFRNLGFSGDEIATRLRSKGFGTPDEWLSGKAEPIGGRTDNRLEGVHTNADVIFAFFGYNESFAGEAGLPKFREDLRAWLTHTLAQRYNGESAPRIVLFSPIAHEDLVNPDLPDGTANNARLQLYSRAMGEEAAAAGVRFVDLFVASMGMYKGTRDAGGGPLTINGVHLNATGNRVLASLIDGLLFGLPHPQRDGAFLDRVQQAVADRNFYWFHRYRVTDGYSTYGDRAFLTFVRGNPRNVDAKVAAATPPEDVLPSNYDVLQRELPILDVMTRNRDQRIWQIARGGPSGPAVPPVNDMNTPPFVDPGTNLPAADAITPGEQAISKMTLGSGLAVNLFASEAEFPELVNPVQMAFDTRGRLWVASWKNYPHWRPKTPMDDKLLILEDTNGDGRADTRTVFAGDLHNPTGFEFYNGGVIVAQQPNLVFLKDTNGDDRYDVKETLLHGFDTADTHHAINSFAFDPGGALYMQEGIFHRTQVESPWAPTLRQADGGVYRFEPRTWKIETFVPMNFPNPHGHVFDHWGRDIIFDATGGQPYYGPSFSTRKYYPAMETTKAPRPGNVRVRPVGGTEILSSRHFPEAMQGNLIVLNTIGFRGLLNYRFSEDGAGLKMDEVEPILQSADNNFRPVDAEIGPDGALYFLDWHNPIVGHMQHNLRDNSRDRLHGRVYRVTYPGRPLLTPKRIAGAPIPDLLNLLKEPENRVRNLAKIELSGRDTTQVIAAVQTWVAGLDVSDPQYQHHLMEALWVHQWHNRVDEALLNRMLKSPEPWARAAATRVLCYWRDRVADPLATLKTLAADPHPAVRLEAVRAASFFQSPEAAAVALTSLDHPQDRFLSYTLDQTMKTLDAFTR